MTDFEIDPKGIPLALHIKITWMQLAQLRKNRDYSQIELAEAVGLKQTTISHIENGRTAPSIEVQDKLAKLFEFKSSNELKDKLESLIHWPNYREVIREYLISDEKNIPIRVRRHSLKPSPGTFEYEGHKVGLSGYGSGKYGLGKYGSGKPRLANQRSFELPKYYEQISLSINNNLLSGTLISKESREFVEAPSILRTKTNDGYFVTIINDEMSPRYKIGDTLLVDPSLKPTTGDDVVLKLYLNGYQVAIVRSLSRIETDWKLVDPLIAAVTKAQNISPERDKKNKAVTDVFNEFRESGFRFDEYRKYFFTNGTESSPETSIIVTESADDGSRKILSEKSRKYLGPGANFRIGNGDSIQMITFHVVVGCYYRVKSESERDEPYSEPER